MLGHVTRWLRLMGFDAEYAGSEARDERLVEWAARDGRVLVTRDLDLGARARREGVRVVLLRGGELETGLAAVLREVEAVPDPAQYLTRCTQCNHELEAADAASVRDRVPPGVLAEAHAFHACPACGKVYWDGTHVTSIELELARVERLVRAGPS